ncbi:uncharacterized protein (TIGR03086 family) [Kitasatospora sp. GP30]|uniref:TIGR03086 family metal-binding protein n=1 Tax=Kitasatospora sp. GP30 TaxID=3035084 RepID=UPI000CAE3482|nr:uncharacterized protein (TIGR03086 family) [Kitasatospora sp. GP30]
MRVSAARALCLDVRYPPARAPGDSHAGSMVNVFDGLIDRFLLSSSEFEQKLQTVRPEQWSRPTPCTEWNVRQLANHMARGNLSYVRLLHGGDSAEFLRLRDVDALGADPVGAYVSSVRECARAFGQDGAMQRVLDYPLGPVTGRQALAVRITDSTVHTWDLARAVGAEESLDAGLVAWIDEHLDEIYAGLAETPTAADTTHRFFAAPESTLPHDASQQLRLLHRMGRTPGGAH